MASLKSVGATLPSSLNQTSDLHHVGAQVDSVTRNWHVGREIAPSYHSYMAEASHSRGVSSPPTGTTIKAPSDPRMATIWSAHSFFPSFYRLFRCHYNSRDVVPRLIQAVRASVRVGTTSPYRYKAGLLD